MTREEAITILKAFMENPLFSEVHKAAFNIAIHDIKQRHDWDINNLILINKDNYEPQEPKTGHWMPSHIPESILDECSECGFSCGAFTFNYCPNCGAKMVSSQESEG